MTNMSGSFVGKASVNTTVSLRDLPNHELSLVEIRGPQRSTESLWNEATITYWCTLDLVQGNGIQRGYYCNERSDGSSDSGSFEGKVQAAGGLVTLEGTWQSAAGTGRLSGVRASGSYRGRMISPTEVDMSWDGAYELPAAQAAGQD